MAIRVHLDEILKKRQNESGEIVRTVCNRGEEFVSLMCSMGDGYLMPGGLTLVWE